MIKRIKRFFKEIGPGVITGASDDDPSGIATYSQAGAKYGLGLLWTAIFMLPMMYVVQEMSARIGAVTGKGIAKNIKRPSEIVTRIVVFFPMLLLALFLLWQIVLRDSRRGQRIFLQLTSGFTTLWGSLAAAEHGCLQEIAC